MGSADLGKNNPISHSLVQNLRQQLMRVLPFSKMVIADVDYFLRHSIEAYFAPNETILSPADGVPKDLYLIRQGRFSGRRLIPGFEEMGFELAAGELFSVSACYAGRPVTSKYVAVEDCFCLAIPVERMHELRLLARCGTKANVRPTRLEVCEEAAARYFEPLPDAGGEDFKVVGLCTGESGIARGQQQHTIRKLKALQDCFRLAGDQFQLFQRGVGIGIADQLHLVELVHAQQSARVLSGGPGFTTEAGAKGTEALRQFTRVKNLVAIQIGDRDFGRGNKKQVVVGDGVGIFLELGEVAGAGH